MIAFRTFNQALLFLVSFIYTVPAFAAFSDVPQNHPNAEAIAYVQAQGIVSGYPDGTYRPDQQINRAEFTKIIEESIPDAEDGIDHCPPDPRDVHSFPDVSTDDWFAFYVCMAKSRGIISGYPDGNFRPAAPVNFVEAAKIIYQANHLDIRGFVNSPQLSYNPWYRAAVQHLEYENALPATIDSFDQHITRGEMAQIIYGINHLTEDEEICRTNSGSACDRDFRRRVDVAQIESAIASYYMKYGMLPIELQEGSLAICTMNAIQEGICTEDPVTDLSFLVKAGLLDNIPVDPSFASGTKHTGYELFEHGDFMSVSALHAEMTHGISALILLPTVQ